jgi:hypothetical protein
VACDSSTLEALAVATNKENGLSERDILVCTASIYGIAVGFANAQAALNQAAADGLFALSERDLRACYLAVIC